MRIKIIERSIEPFVLTQLRQHLRIDSDIDSDGHPEDTLISEVYLPAAIEACENFLGQSIGLKTVERAMDFFPETSRGLTDPIELIYPVKEVLSVKYYSPEGIEETMNPEAYEIDDYESPSFLVLKEGYAWPEVEKRINAVKLRYVTGYTFSSPLPFAIRSAVLLQLGHLYENREDTTDKPSNHIASGVEALLRPLRTRKGMA